MSFSMLLPAGPSGGRPVAPSRGALRPLGVHEVRIVGGFWGARQTVNADASLDHCRQWMDKLGWTGHFLAADRSGAADRRGREFSDSEVYKLLEAMAWETGRSGGVDQSADIAELTDAISAAQAPDGYLNTAFGRPGQRARYSDLNFGHELYCTGHLLQAAVARARTTGDDALVQVAKRAADHVCDAFGPDGLAGVCGHPEIEPALVELARVTGEQRYLDQAGLFIGRRGHRSLAEHELGWSYFQDETPVREATVLRGHAVRSLYLASGAVDLAVETGDTELLEAVASQYARTLARRTYLTGGMGSRHLDEAFGDDFVLPADRAYSETCAGVASVMLAWRLLLATGDHRYANTIERTLYNVIATSVADDGRSFFYANTLHQRTFTESLAPDKEQLRFGGGPRAPWFEVSCCLPNVARLLAGLSGYLVTADARSLHVHQYADADVATRLDDGRAVGFQMRTSYPDDGAVTVRITETAGGPWGLVLRVPDWAGVATLTGPDGVRRDVGPGTVEIYRTFAVGDELRLDLPLEPRWTFPDPRIDAVKDCAAVERGPLVLCAESTTPGDDLDVLRVDTSVPAAGTGDGATVRGRFVASPESAWPYGPGHRAIPGPARDVQLVPYHRWARRGPSTMRVWLPIT